MLPLDGRNGRYAQNRRRPSSYESNSNLTDYFSMIFDTKQLDVESACDQYATILSFDPGRVYKRAYYRKQTKNRWARDDPTFALIQMAFSTIAAIAYGVAFSSYRVWNFIALIAYFVIVHWLLSGLVIATAGRMFANAYLIVTRSHSVEQRVEWFYAFDIHCNAFFMLFMALHVGQYLLLPILMSSSFISMVLSNSLYAFGLGSYFYITHLGYRSLPFLSRTETLLQPVIGIIMLLISSFFLALLGIQINMTRVVMNIHF